MHMWYAYLCDVDEHHHAYIHTCIHTYMHVWIHANMVCIHSCVHTSSCFSGYLAYMHTCIRTFTHTQTFMHTSAGWSIRRLLCIHTHTYIHTYIHTYRHGFYNTEATPKEFGTTDVCMCVCVCACVCVCVYIYIYIYIYIYEMHMYVCVYVCTHARTLWVIPQSGGCFQTVNIRVYVCMYICPPHDKHFDVCVYMCGCMHTHAFIHAAFLQGLGTTIVCMLLFLAFVLCEFSY